MALVYLVLISLFPLFLLLLLLLRQLRNPNPSSTPPPSPPRLPIIGNLHQLGSLPHRSLRALSDRHGPVILLYLGRIPTLLVSSASAAREIMRDHDAVFASRPQSKVVQTLNFGADDLAFAPYGAYWRYVRKLCVTRLLSAKMVQSFSLMREQEVALMIDNISATTPMTIIDMSDILYSFANDVLCRAVSGKFATGEGRNKLFRELIEEFSKLLGEFHVGDYFPGMRWVDDLFFGLTARAERNSSRWSVLLDEVIDSHAANRRRGVGSEDFVDVLLSLPEEEQSTELTKENVKALLLDMFAAGTDTTYILLEWAMVELVRNPEAMKKLQDEVREIVRGKNKIREEDLSEMRYLKSVLKEVLRLHPPVPLLVPRESMADCKVKDYMIPNKTRVIINAWAISRDPKLWEEPEGFLPDRFLNSPIDFKGNDFQFTPFGGGRRICPGMNFATATAELALANLIYLFDWELPDGMTRENWDMTEAPGFSVHRKQKLELLVKSYCY